MFSETHSVQLLIQSGLSFGHKLLFGAEGLQTLGLLVSWQTLLTQAKLL